MDGGRKSKQGLAVALIFRTRKLEEGQWAEEQREYDSDSTASDISHQNANPIMRDDLRGLLHDIKANMAAEFTKHLAPLRAGLTDLVQRTSSLEDKMDTPTTVRCSTWPRLRQTEESKRTTKNATHPREIRTLITEINHRLPADQHRTSRSTRLRCPDMDYTRSRTQGH
ncbi:Hypothetical predicted protein [Pelobates cultripes]|uniref:Uncharacterized protein n=1 Tax=Pelobates cultripes TaxID=61616 RepID=A0AAD1VZR6_PELCU|nr:Hypothetical predicted protein [Pelobates cultripes]